MKLVSYVWLLGVVFFGVIFPVKKEAQSLVSLLHDGAITCASSDVVLGRSYVFNDDISFERFITCASVGYIVTAITTFFHELGHAEANYLLYGRRSQVILGNGDVRHVYASIHLPHESIIVAGGNPCKGCTLHRSYFDDNKAGNWRILCVKMAGGAAGIAAAYGLKVLAFLWSHRDQSLHFPLKTLKSALREALFLDSVTVGNLYAMFWPFADGNDGAYWRTFLFGS